MILADPCLHNYSSSEGSGFLGLAVEADSARLQRQGMLYVAGVP